MNNPSHTFQKQAMQSLLLVAAINETETMPGRGMHEGTVMSGLEQAGHYTCRLWALLEHVKGMQDITRTLQGLRGRWAHPHTDPSLMALPAQPHTHKEPATPNPSLPSLLQVCGEQKTDHRAARCPGGKAACRASRTSAREVAEASLSC